ncbi:hypothetical protein [Brevibacterium sediminis]
MTSFAFFTEAPDIASSLIFLILFGPAAIVFLMVEVLIFSLPVFNFSWRVKKNDSLMTFVWCIGVPAVAAYLLGTVGATLVDRRHKYFSYFEIAQYHGAILALPTIALFVSGILSVPVLRRSRARKES